MIKEKEAVAKVQTKARKHDGCDIHYKRSQRFLKKKKRKINMQRNMSLVAKVKS